MHYHRLRIILTVLLLVLAVIFQVQWGWSAAWPLYLGAAALLLIYLLFGTTRLAFQALQRGQVFEAEKLLQQTRFPQLLVKANKSQYYFVQGLLHIQHKELEEGEAAIQQALSTGLVRQKEEALAWLNLAHISFVQEQPAKSREALAKAQSLNQDDLLLKERLNELEQALSRRYPGQG